MEAGGVGRLEVWGGWRCGEARWGGWRCAGGKYTIIVTMEHRIYGNVNHALTSRDLSTCEYCFMATIKWCVGVMNTLTHLVMRMYTCTCHAQYTTC